MGSLFDGWQTGMYFIVSCQFSIANIEKNTEKLAQQYTL